MGVHHAQQILELVEDLVVVLMTQEAIEHVGDGLEAPMGVPGGALGLAGGIVDLAHLVHVHERVEGGQVDAGEGAPHWEALALQAGGCRRHGEHGAVGRSLVRLWDPWQDHGVGADRWHDCSLL
jgi:hypothetical protein